MRGSDRSMARAISGPIMLITVGVLFALNNFTPYGLGQTWPVLLIVPGLLSLWRRGSEPPAPPPPAGGPGFPQYTYPPPPGGYPPPPGGYREGPYSGTSGPPQGDPGQTPRSGDSI
jgi:hypothetical protein